MDFRKRVSILIGFTILALTIIFPLPAMSGGWFQTNSSDTVGSGYWADQDNNTSYTAPHGGFTSASNLCKTCHAVHLAGTSSYRLLKSGTTEATRTQGEGSAAGMGNRRATECMYCHDASSGASSKKPYEIGATNVTIRGEHTLGATGVPDSDINGGSNDEGNLANRDPSDEGAVLQCYQCHSVHGADTIGQDNNNDGILDPTSDDATYNSNGLGENWNSKILRIDPAGDGSVLGKGSGGLTAGEWAAELATDAAAVRTGFCADCHNQNSNWLRTTNDTDRPNARSHPQGPGADGLMEINGTTGVAKAAHTSEVQGCRGCHAATGGATADSRFPHQSVGWKLLWDTYQSVGTTNYAGDPNRVLPAMDKACLMCHPADDEFDTGKGYSDATTEQKLCFRCHKLNSFANAPDIESQFSKESTHPVGVYSGRHSEDEWTDPVASLGESNRHSECIDCHDMDMLLQGQGTPLKGIWGVSVDNGLPNTTPSFTKVDEVLYEYELCFKCHSAYTTRPESMFYETTSGAAIDPQGDKAREFNPNNNSFHPIEAIGRNQSTVLNNQLATAGLTTSSTIKCTDCHNADETSDATGSANNSSFEPKGTHGSTNTPLLRGNYKVDLTPWATTYDANNFELCFLCHDETKLVLGLDTNFYSTSAAYSNLHRVHLKEIVDDVGNYGYSAVAICRNCHYDSHSNRQSNTSWAYDDNGTWYFSEDNGDNPPAGVKVHLVSFSPDLLATGARSKPRWTIRANGQRRCQLRCHNADMSHSYTPIVGTDDSPTF